MRKIKLLLCIVTLVGSVTISLGQQSAKSPISVLIVGYDPAKPMPEMFHSAPSLMSVKDFTAEYPVRMPSFKALLSQYFATVKTIDCRDWIPADSEPYDVTIFDFPTRILHEAKKEKNADGSTKYIPAAYLTEDFTKPTIFIASTADEMGRSIGTKLDWLCLCLDADAHHLNTKHAIFNGPIEKVTLTMVTKPTPEGIYHYSSGADVSKKIPMWRVDKVGYLEGKGGRVGLVARGNRFMEGPDVEMISSGVCLKDVGAIALGRHGNFFMWGFAASPAGMTEEAKKVFANTVAYMKQFDGQAPIARKRNDRMATTDDVKETVAMATKEHYENYVAKLRGLNESNAKEVKRINEKKAGGEVLTSTEEESLKYLTREQKIDTWESYLKGKMGKFSEKFGNDAEAFQKYMKEHMGYIYCDPNAFSSYIIDEDVQQIGISNHDVKLLDACIRMLKKGDRTELALRVLNKYTAQDFRTAAEWSNWLLQNKKKLFFSETDGYKFIINPKIN